MCYLTLLPLLALTEGNRSVEVVLFNSLSVNLVMFNSLSAKLVEYSFLINQCLG